MPTYNNTSHPERHLREPLQHWDGPYHSLRFRTLAGEVRTSEEIADMKTPSLGVAYDAVRGTVVSAPVYCMRHTDAEYSIYEFCLSSGYSLFVSNDQVLYTDNYIPIRADHLFVGAKLACFFYSPNLQGVNGRRENKSVCYSELANYQPVISYLSSAGTAAGETETGSPELPELSICDIRIHKTDSMPPAYRFFSDGYSSILVCADEEQSLFTLLHISSSVQSYFQALSRRFKAASQASRPVVARMQDGISGDTLLCSSRGLLSAARFYEAFTEHGGSDGALFLKSSDSAICHPVSVSRAGLCDAWAVQLANGMTLAGTADHRVLVETGGKISWKPLRELTPEDYCFLDNNTNLATFGTVHNQSEAAALGCLFGGGKFVNGRLSITHISDAMVDPVRVYLASRPAGTKEDYTPETFFVEKGYTLSRELSALMEQKYGLLNPVRCHFSEDMLCGSSEYFRSFFRYFLSYCGRTVFVDEKEKEGGEFQVTHKSQQLLSQIQVVLLSLFGISCRLEQINEGSVAAWRLIIQKASLPRLLRAIPIENAYETRNLLFAVHNIMQCSGPEKPGMERSRVESVSYYGLVDIYSIVLKETTIGFIGNGFVHQCEPEIVITRSDDGDFQEKAETAEV